MLSWAKIILLCVGVYVLISYTVGPSEEPEQPTACHTKLIFSGKLQNDSRVKVTASTTSCITDQQFVSIAHDMTLALGNMVTLNRQQLLDDMTPDNKLLINTVTLKYYKERK